MTPQERRRLARVGTAMIALGGAVVILSVTNGALAGFGWPPGLIIILLGVIFVAMSTGVHQGEVTIGGKRIGFDLKPRAVDPGPVPPAAGPETTGSALPARAGSRQRSRRRCRLIKRERV
jgi:hypothetical protein